LVDLTVDVKVVHLVETRVQQLVEKKVVVLAAMMVASLAELMAELSVVPMAVHWASVLVYVMAACLV